MILQVSYLAQPSNKLQKKMAVNPLVIMAIYIHSDLEFLSIWACEYLLYQPDPLNKKVSVQMDPFLDPCLILVLL
jgi:hypothetical protein